MRAVYCGLDVHKESTYATILDQTGQVATQIRMKNEEVPQFLQPLEVEKVAMEASTYIIPMYRRLVDEGYDVTVSHISLVLMVVYAAAIAATLIGRPELRYSIAYFA
jgi:hypothetical protein